MMSKFKFYEVVKVKESDFTQINNINGLIGVVLAQNENGEWGYAIQINELEEVWDLTENSLEATGEFTSEEEFYGNKMSIHIKVDSKTGEGDII